MAQAGLHVFPAGFLEFLLSCHGFLTSLSFPLFLFQLCRHVCPERGALPICGGVLQRVRPEPCTGRARMQHGAELALACGKRPGVDLLSVPALAEGMRTGGAPCRTSARGMVCSVL